MVLRLKPLRTTFTETGVCQREFKARQDSTDHQFHLKLGERHANATPDASTKWQILERRITAFQKALGPEFIGI